MGCEIALFVQPEDPHRPPPSRGERWARRVKVATLSSFAVAFVGFAVAQELG